MISQSLSHLLFRVTPYDPLTFGGVAAFVAAGSIAAVLLLPGGQQARTLLLR